MSGIDGIALTKLDVLDGFDEIKVCIGYTLDGAAHRQPAGRPQRAGARQADLRDASKAGRSRRAGRARWADLPAQAVKYVRQIEELIECPVTLLSTSPERDDTILMRDPFED